MSNNWVQIGVWGDSIVHGGGDLELGGWVNRLRLYLAGRGLGDHVFNLGLGGQNSTEVLGRIGYEVTARAHHIDHVLIGVGMNDLAYKIKQNPVEVFRANVRKIGEVVKATGKNPILLTMTPCRFEDQRKWEAMNAAVREVAAEDGIALIDLSGAFELELLSDALHPGPEGYARIYEKVKRELMGLGIISAE